MLLPFCTIPGPKAATRSPPFSDTIATENLFHKVKILFLKPLRNLEMSLHRWLMKVLAKPSLASLMSACLALKEAVHTTASCSVKKQNKTKHWTAFKEDHTNSLRLFALRALNSLEL